MLTTLATRNRGPHLDKCAPVSLVTNLFKVDFKEDTKIYIYAARTEPKIAFDNNKKLRAIIINSRKIIERLIGTYVQTGRCVFGTKGQYCQIGQDVTFNVEFQGQSYYIFLKLVKAVVLKDLYCPDKRRSGIVFGFLSSMLKNFFYQIGYSEIGRTGKYFDSKHMVNIESAKVYIYKGYSSNFSLLEAGLFLRIDAAVKVIRNETALEVINGIYSKYPNLNKQEKRRIVQMELIGKMVMANYGKCAHYIIESVLYDVPVDKYFFTCNNTQISLVQYYKKNYGITINPRQPLLKAVNNRMKKLKKEHDIIIVPELVLMGGLPDNFDERKRRQISEQTIIPPSQRFKEISSVFSSFNEESDGFNPKMIADKLGISFDTKTSQIQGKQLPMPELQLGKRNKVDDRKTTNFMLFDKPLFESNIPLHISVIYPPNFDFSPSKNLLGSTCKNLGLQYEFVTQQMKFFDANTTLRNIKQFIERQCKVPEQSPNIFWIVIPPAFKANYGAIKKLVLQAGIEKNSQITVASTFMKKGFPSVFTKILLQMSAKVGNKLWVPRLSSKLPEAGIMMLGLEKCKVTSDPDAIMITYCANSNRQCSTFYSNYIIHKKAEDFKTHLNEIVFACITQYVRCNGQAPSDVLLIKNGSTSHENSTVISGEVTQIKDVLHAWQGSKRINLIYLLLDKDTNQKFFIERGRDLVNPQSGLLVNSHAVGQQFQFYLVAQQSTKGSVRPTFYRVVFCDSTIEEGLIEELLFGQCFNYMNWSGAIKVPAVMQYAKKLSIFAGQHIGEKCVGESLSRHLYYI